MTEATATFRTMAPHQTRALAELLGRGLVAGDVVGLVGEVGAGKTCFAQGLAVGLEVDEAEYVRSPSFAMVNLHRGRVELAHVDLYRLSEPEEAVLVGYEDLFDGATVVVVEWFDLFPELWPGAFLEVTLRDLGGECREIQARALGSRPARAIELWEAAWEAAREAAWES